MIKNQDILPWIRLAFGVSAILLFVWNRRASKAQVSLSGPDLLPLNAATPVFIWDDWQIEDDDRIVLQFRTERALVWWLTIDGASASIREQTVMPKNFLPGQKGRIEMRSVGLLESSADECLEFGVRYCTTTGKIETQKFSWMIWRDAAPVAVQPIVCPT